MREAEGQRKNIMPLRVDLACTSASGRVNSETAFPEWATSIR